MNDDRLKRLLELCKYAQEQGFNLIVVRDFTTAPQPILEPTMIRKIFGVYVENGYMDYRQMNHQIQLLGEGPESAK